MTVMLVGPAYQMVKLVWDNHPGRDKYSRRPKSWRRLNDALRKVLDAAIEVGFKFHATEIEQIYGDFCGQFWFGCPAGERFYCIAVKAGNISACRSWEAWQEIRPFMWQGRHMKTAKRLGCSSTFHWEGETVRVTSLHATHLIACAYDDPWSCRKPKRRYSITHKQLRAANRKAKDG